MTHPLCCPGSACLLQALHIAEFFQNNKHDPVCVKVLQRRATAFKALDQLDRAVQDLTAALELEPGNKAST